MATQMPPCEAESSIAENAEPPPITGWFMLLYAFTQYAAWLAIFTPVVITMAFKVRQIVPEAQKGVALGEILALGALCALLSAPICGALSDRTKSRMGSRKVWIAGGSLALLGGLMIVGTADSLLQVGLGWMICQSGANATQASLSATLPDAVPARQRGRMSGFLGLTIPLALVTGTFITQFTRGSDLAMFIVPWLPSLVAIPLFLKFLPASPSGPAAPFSPLGFLKGFWINPVRYPDFAWVFSSRFLIVFAAAFAQTYQVYFLTDHIGVALAQVATYVFIGKLTIAGLTVVLTPIFGWLSDKTGRIKPFVFMPALMVALALFVISTSTTVPQFMIGIVLLGIGQSVYGAVDMALCVAVLPSRASAAKDIGLIQIANSLPQSLAPAVAPLFLAIGPGNNNYPAVFIAATAIGILGAVTVLPVKKVK